MTDNYHTPITEGAAANSQTINNPLGQLDEALSEALLAERDGHIIQDDGADVAQQARLNFTGAGVTVTPEVGKTTIEIPGGVTDHGALAGLSDDDHPQYSMKYADTPNLAVNAGFEFAQEQTPGTYTTVADKGYGPDQWWSTRENADVQYIRSDGTGEAGITSKYFGTFKKITNTGKVFICQPIEGRDAVPLRGRTVIFVIKLKASSAKTIRMAVLELQSGGTIDAPPATLVTAFSANGVDPTFGSNVAIITAAQNKSVTTLFSQFSVSVTVPAASKNLFLAIWTNDQFAANDTLSVAEADFYPGSAARVWRANPYADDLNAVKRYYNKSFALDTAPAQNAGTVGVIRFPATKAGANTNYFSMFKFCVPMFATPTLTYFNPSAANAQVRDSDVGGDCSSTATGATPTNNEGFLITTIGHASSAVGNRLEFHYTAKARIL